MSFNTQNPKSDSLSWDIAARKCVFSNLSFEKLRFIACHFHGKSQDIVYAVTTSGKQTFPDSWWHSICLEDPWLSGLRAETGYKRQQLSIQIRWNVVAVLLCQFWATVRPILSDCCPSVLSCLWLWCIVAKRSPISTTAELLYNLVLQITIRLLRKQKWRESSYVV